MPDNSGSDMPEVGEPFSRFLQLLRGSVRPVVTVGVLVIASWLIMLARVVPDWYQTLVVGIVMFWFGQRSK